MHIKYVPTQVVTEYVRTAIPATIEAPVEAMLLVNGARPASIVIHAKVRCIRQRTALVSVVEYADPATSMSHAEVGNYELGASEIIENCDNVTMMRNSGISRPVSVASPWIRARSSLMRSLSRPTKFFQPLAESLENAVEPARVELETLIILEEVLPKSNYLSRQIHVTSFRKIGERFVALLNSSGRFGWGGSVDQNSTD